VNEALQGVRTAGTELTVGAVPRQYARIEPRKCALYDAERSITYGELDAQVDALARSLVGLGVNRGDVVCAYLPNCIDYVIVVLAVARSGAIFSPINPRYKTFEVTAILRQARPRVTVTTRAGDAVVREAAGAAGLQNSTRVHVDAESDAGEVVALRPLLVPREEPRLPEVAETDFFSLMFTSGTTGEPKGALATHRGRMVWVLNATVQYGLDERDRYLGTMPQVHSAGLTFTLMHLYAGATVRIMPHFDADEFLAIVERERITSALSVPTMLTMIVEAIGHGTRPRSTATLKRLVTCGSPLPLATKRRVIEKVTAELYDYYGSTESNSMTVLRPADQLRKPQSVGQPFRNVEIMIADANGNACAPGVVGEVWCVNPSVMSAYRDRPEETQRAFTGRWYHTGDLGFLDDEGFLHLVSRLSDVVISGGVNIYPAEIEQVLMLHPSVLDAAVIGVPDAKWGEAVKAFLVVRAGERLDLAAVQEHCSRLLADFKKPRSVEFLEALPKNAGGKTIKADLRKRGHG
jgi:acyl-CoA synthetase (AMP-forming)/AMP-acid ligase II